MEMVGMVITKNWFSGPKSRSVNNSVQQTDLGLPWDFTPWVSRPDKMNPPPGQISQFHPLGLIMTCRVAS